MRGGWAARACLRLGRARRARRIRRVRGSGLMRRRRLTLARNGDHRDFMVALSRDEIDDIGSPWTSNSGSRSGTSGPPPGLTRHFSCEYSPLREPACAGGTGLRLAAHVCNGLVDPCTGMVTACRALSALAIGTVRIKATRGAVWNMLERALPMDLDHSGLDASVLRLHTIVVVLTRYRHTRQPHRFRRANTRPS
jgi:hypothetical protein